MNYLLILRENENGAFPWCGLHVSSVLPCAWCVLLTKDVVMRKKYRVSALKEVTI